jgi:hypothetical protein
MGLIDLKTDLKSLRYGNDRVYGGNSGQPYITTPIPDDISPYIGTTDFLLRGGVNAALDSLEDVKRLGKMFIDTKSPNGILFIAKQQLLSQTSVRTQTSGVINNGTYSPLNTLAEAGLIAFGGHLNKQGTNPFAETGAYANNINLYQTRVTSTQPSENNRLVGLYDAITRDRSIANWNLSGFNLNVGPNVLSYDGGPNAINGKGQTNIRFASPNQRTGVQNPQAVTNPSYFYGSYKKVVEPGLYLQTINSTNPSTISGVSGKYIRLTKDTFSNPYNNLGQLGQGYYNFSVYEPAIEGNTWPKNSPLIYENNTFTYNQEDLIQEEVNTGKFSGSPRIQDFRKKLRAKLGVNTAQGKAAAESGATPDSLNYSGENAGNIEKRVNIGDPGQRANKSYVSYVDGVVNLATNASYYSNASVKGIGQTPVGLDKINSLPIYRSQAVAQDPIVNDLVKFRIAAIDNNSPSFKTFMHFRAFLDSMSDAYSANWNSIQYLGRGEQFFTYGGFTRQISLGWTVAAQSKQELIPMYKKLNYLASLIAPDYSSNGYMRGNLVQLTIGGYLYEQPGFITGLTFDMSESTWDIAINDKGQGTDGTVKELPHIIKVTGFSFTPIHRFIPKKQQLTFGADGKGFVESSGDQRFIALANGENIDQSNYNLDNTSTAPITQAQ